MITSSSCIIANLTLFSVFMLLMSQSGAAPLMAASCNGHVEVVDKLLQHGARVDLQDKVV